MVIGGFRERQYRIEGGSEPRGMIEREDEEGPDEGRRRCLNAFWAVGRRVEGLLFLGVFCSTKNGKQNREQVVRRRLRSSKQPHCA
jgi:hypothetical protein